MKGGFFRRQVRNVLVGVLVIGALAGFEVQKALADTGWTEPPSTVDWRSANDVNGPDDVPGQKDLNFLRIGRDLANPMGYVYVEWGWDDTAISGNNTLDGCVLFDTDVPQNGFADVAFCVIASGVPAVWTSHIMYTCSDSSAVNCTQPHSEVNPTLYPNTHSTTDFINNTDPFTGKHTKGCSGASPDCLTQDTRARATIKLSEINATSASLLNVCSYTSGSPTSNASDCIFMPESGFLTIHKDTDPQTTSIFNFTTDPSPSGNPTINVTAGSDHFVSFTPGAVSVTENAKTGWYLNSISCKKADGTTSTGTVNLTTGTVSGVAIESGKYTTCTFVNKPEADLSVDKTDGDYYYSYSYPGGPISYTITVTNTGTRRASGVVITDHLDANFDLGVDVDEDPYTSGLQVTFGLTRNGTTASTIQCTSTLQIGGVLTCPVGNMEAGEVLELFLGDITGEGAAGGTISHNTLVSGMIEIGTCTQNPNKQGTDAVVDMCNVVDVSATNEPTEFVGLENHDSDPRDVVVPNSATIINFAAEPKILAVSLGWETTEELDNLGFNLYRATSPDGKRQKVNKSLISTKVIPGSSIGTTYTYLDKGLSPNKTYYYWIEDISTSNVATVHELIATAQPVKMPKPLRK